MDKKYPSPQQSKDVESKQGVIYKKRKKKCEISSNRRKEKS